MEMSAVPNAVRVRRALENAIVDGQYPPGSRLDPEALAQEFECSRTPIREALSRLTADGLAEAHRGRGVVVSQVSLEDVRALFELREALDCRAA